MKLIDPQIDLSDRIMCCCAKKCKEPHYESIKFQIDYQTKEDEKMTLFMGREKGKLIDY